MQSINIFELPLSERDKYLTQVENQMQAKKDLINEKRVALNENIKQNHFLENVREDYNKYYNYIIQQKKDQVKAMQILDDYVKDIIISNKLTENDLQNAKREQQQILDQLDVVKRELDTLISNK